MENQNKATVGVAPLSLPKGNGTVSGMGESLSGMGPDGMLSLSLPLPVSAGRGDAPALSLNYNSGSGNGPFGQGWSCPVMSVARRTARGVPNWQDDDEFIGPDGEVLIRQPGSQRRGSLRGMELAFCTVTYYRPRTESAFSRIERWVPEEEPEGMFWVIYSPEGGLQLLGFTEQARMANPQVPGQTALWLLEETVSATGEHQYHQYRAENNERCDAQELAAHPQATAQRYLSRVYYGNIVASDTPFVLNRTPAVAEWLFCLVLDYGEHAGATWPAFSPAGTWAVRPDCFSDYKYGFELRTRRLCRQVLMYHRINALQGQADTPLTWTLCGWMKLRYDECAAVTTLVSVSRHSTDPDMPAELPPLEFDWQEPSPAAGITWSALDSLGELYSQKSWQLVDLYGEGLPGILYQDDRAWWYSAPVRGSEASPDAVTWSVPVMLPVAPAAHGQNMLMDLTHDGRPDWLISQPGLQGYFTLNADKSWSSFIPVSALPTEFFHPSAQLQDFTGSGNPDLIMMGPDSVRIWAAQDTHWDKAHEVRYSGRISLPSLNHDAGRAVVFTDILGSGQQHLTDIRADGVTVWPSLGRGRFGEAREIPGFSIPDDTFNPSRLYLADTDGSGSSDILYVQSDRILVFLNQCGNRFVSAPSVMLPAGVRFDDTCQLQIGDLQGLGVASVLLTVPHPEVRHWCCHLNHKKPWLLQSMNNNMGASHTFTYRSSAQFWLDEKAQKPDAVCHLPFPLHTLWKQTLTDEITGNQLTSESRYYQGVWDARERELRGFTCVEQRDTTTATVETDTPPLLTRSWYASGVKDIDETLPAQYWQGDENMFTPYTPRMTVWLNNEDQPLNTGEDTWWLHRALRGHLLHSESYGHDGSAQQALPYTVNDTRWQVRRMDTGAAAPVVMPLSLETRQYHYERIAADPLISQTVSLVFDNNGTPVDTLTIAYPRRSAVSVKDYPDMLQPVSIVADSQDEQQQRIHLTRVRSRLNELNTNDLFRPALPELQRTDVCSLPAREVPAVGFCFENLTSPSGIMSAPAAKGAIDHWFENGEWVFAGQQKVYYTAQAGEVAVNVPTAQALVAFTEMAVFDKSVFSLTDALAITPELLAELGYVKVVDTKTRDTNMPLVIWGSRQGYTDYGSAAQFWRPVAQRASLLIGKTRIEWDKHVISPIRQIDAAGLTTSVHIDYRYLQPTRMMDVNDNETHMIPDGFGQPLASRFSGTENGVPTGYSVWTPITFPLPSTVEKALALRQPVPLASFTVMAADSWMYSLDAVPGLPDSGFRAALSSAGVISASGRLCMLAWERYLRRHGGESNVAALDTWLRQQSRLPPHQLTVTTDRYDTDNAQQQRQTIQFSDGAGRLLQVSVRHESGVPDWHRTATGVLVKSTGESVANRWAVSGRTEFNNKGLPVRHYQPFFLNDWRYVSDDSARQDLWSDAVFYDAPGREIKTVTAKEYLRRTQYYPWFTVKEDENDTAQEVLSLKV